MIFQELSDGARRSPSPRTSCLGHWPTRRGLVDWRRARRQARGDARRARGRTRPRRARSARCGSLSARWSRSLGRSSGQTRCLILDEPTAALSHEESSVSSSSSSACATSGVAIIYITHRLDEVRQIADRVQVLRDGWTVLDGRSPITTRARSSRRWSVGRSTPRRVRRRPPEPEDTAPMLRLRAVSSASAFADVDLDVRAGEVVALYGRSGAGTAGGRRGDLRGAQPVVGLDRDRRPPIARRAGRPTPHGRASGWSPATVSAMVRS